MKPVEEMNREEALDAGLVGTVITGMVDPKVPSFWPHDEVHFHIGHINRLLMDQFMCLPFYSIYSFVFRPGRRTRPGWMLLRMRSTRDGSKERRTSNWSKDFVPQLHPVKKPGAA